MSNELARFGVAMEGWLLRALDDITAARESTRSEVLRDLVRAEVARTKIRAGGYATGALFLLYEHGDPELAERLTAMQHALGSRARTSLHVHVDAKLCLECVLIEGPAQELREAADRILAARGVKHGEVVLFPLPRHASNREAGVASRVHSVESSPSSASRSVGKKTTGPRKSPASVARVRSGRLPTKAR